MKTGGRAGQHRRDSMSHPPSSVLFPGQGSQAAGMGRHLAEASEDAMSLWKKAEQYSGVPLREIFWESNDHALMSETRNAQPAITVVNLALYHYVLNKINPICTAGHSLGEFSALAAAGVLTMDEVLRAVSLRGRLMSEADPEQVGTMFAIMRLSREQVEKICHDVSEKTGKLVKVANHNTPGQYAVSGHKDAVDEVAEEARALKGKAIPLAVSGAFHTPMMAGASAEFAVFLDTLEWRDPRYPVYLDSIGNMAESGEKIHQIMRRQMTSPVFWTDIITKQWENGVRHWVEFGPQGVLTRMMRAILSPYAGQEDYTTVHIPNMAGADAYSG